MSHAASQEQGFPAHWEVLSFDQAFEDVTGGNPRIQTTDYLPEGRLRVIDQGQSPVAGYVNDASLACKATLPCILFGDHTRLFKFADSPFALGADGVKVLAPLAGLNARFAFHYLRTVWLPDDLGYSRHFKYLRRARVPRPPPAEQRRIADMLDKADAIRRKRKEAIALTEELLRSTFLDMFGDPVTNPKGWHTSTVGIECRNNGGALQTGPFGSQLHASDYSDEGTPVVMPQDIVGGTISEKRIARVHRQHVERLGQHRLELGDVIFSRRGDVARFAVVSEKSVGWLCGTGCLRIRLGAAALTAGFLKGELAHPSTRRWLEQEAKGTTMPNLNTTILGALPIRIPPRDLQERFSQFVSHHEAVLGKSIAALASTDQVFSSLVARAFSGTLEAAC